jgi:hypothetical protein
MMVRVVFDFDFRWRVGVYNPNSVVIESRRWQPTRCRRVYNRAGIVLNPCKCS